VDDCTRYRTIYLLQKKSEVFAAFKLYKAFAEKQTGFRIKALRDDKGGEYMSKDMDTFLKEHGIMREHTTTATPQQNGVAERSNRIFDEGIKSMLNEASLPGSFWGDALGAFVHVLNRSP
jgi:transposase InsO family protein